MSDDKAPAAYSWNWPLRMAPNWLNQPINTGWTFGNVIVSSTNSSAPDVEQEVVRQHSYGRQIGRVMDVVAVLAERLPDKVKSDHRKALDDFDAIREAVAQIKEDARKDRFARLRRELDALKQEDLQSWKLLIGPR